MTDSPSLRANPLISQWLSVDDTGTVALRVGKVELGQGIHTALQQIAVDELGLPGERVVLVPPSTATSPNEGFTAGSMSIEVSGAAVRAVCAAARELFLTAAAQSAGVSADSLAVRDGCFYHGDTSVGSYASLSGAVGLDVEATGRDDPTTDPGAPQLQRIDLPDKVFGRPCFIQDLELPDMVHARVIRPPLLRAALAEIPADALAGLPARVTLVRDGDFLAVVADREELVMAAAPRLARALRWEPLDVMPDEDKLPDWLRIQQADTSILVAPAAGPRPRRGPGTRASYSRAMIAHASIATSCALARFDGQRLEVWSHTQGIFPLRAALAAALGMAPPDVTVHHLLGAGCYGHNPADDVAFDAALVCLHTQGRPVRLLWDRAGELGSAPLGSAMTADVSARLAPDGTVREWTYELWSNGFLGRPGYAGTVGLLADGYRDGGRPLPPSVDPPLAAGLGSGRNAVPAYAFEDASVTTHLLRAMPIRTSSIRSLGAHFNVFAVESFLDELALLAGEDPLEFRLARLPDERGRAVLAAAAARAGWACPLGGDRDIGRGLGYARYKNKGMYCAVVAEVAAGDSVQVLRLTVAVDAGRVVNLDGLRNQIEGGAVQATSWTLRERVRFDATGVTSLGWDSYPILRFPDVPRVDVEVIDRPDRPSVGAGEGVAGPVAAAIANGLCAAIGVRVRTLPLTVTNVVKAIEHRTDR